MNRRNKHSMRNVVTAAFTLLVAALMPITAKAAIAVLCSGTERQLAAYNLEAACKGCFDVGTVKASTHKNFNPINIMNVCGKMSIDIKIYGVINFADSYILNSLNFYFHEDSIRSVILASEGGYVEPAIEMGRMISRFGTLGVVPGRCYSACVLILAGAGRRLIAGDDSVGIHRIAVDRIPSDLLKGGEPLEGYFKNSWDSIHGYLINQGVSSELVSAMKSIPSSTIRTLDSRELTNYGLGYYNVARSELMRYRINTKCGERRLREYQDANELINRCYLQNGCNTPDEEMGAAIRVIVRSEYECGRE